MEANTDATSKPNLMRPSQSLKGEAAIVTGSTAGLGKVIAKMFVLAGAQVVVTGRDAKRGTTVVEDINESTSSGDKKADSGTAIFVPADLTQEEDLKELIVRCTQDFGHLTILVNSAVMLKNDGPAEKVEPTDFRAILETNLIAPASLIRLAIPAMEKAGHGSIVNISSRTAERASPRLAAYTASKGGLTALTRSVALDYAHLNIRANTIQPGYIIHETRDMDNSPERNNKIRAMGLLPPAHAEDIAFGCIYLASSQARAITGIALNIDSGSTAARGESFDSAPTL